MNDILSHEVFVHSKTARWVVFIHGAGGAKNTWKYQLQDFRQHYNLLTLDLRDHGESKNMEPDKNQYSFDLISEDVHLLLQHLEVKEAIFVSLSLGSILLQHFALKYPKVVCATIMAGAVFRVNKRIRLFIATALIATRFIPYRMMYVLFSWLVMPRKNHQLARRIFVKQSLKLTQKEYDKWLTLYQEFHPLTTAYFDHPFNHPQLIVMGEEDYIFIDAAQSYAQQAAHTQLVIIPRAGHISNIDAPEAFNRHSLEFLSKLIIE